MKTEIAKDALPTEPEPGLKWKRDVAEVNLTFAPTKIIAESENADDPEEYVIPKGYSVTVERWTMSSDHSLILGKVYMIQGVKFGKPTTTYIAPMEQVARIGGKILYNVQKIKPIAELSPAKPQKEQDLDSKLASLDAKLAQLAEAVGAK